MNTKVNEDTVDFVKKLFDAGVSFQMVLKLAKLSGPTVSRIRQAEFDFGKYKELIKIAAKPKSKPVKNLGVLSPQEHTDVVMVEIKASLDQIIQLLSEIVQYQREKSEYHKNRVSKGYGYTQPNYRG